MKAGLLALLMGLSTPALAQWQTDFSGFATLAAGKTNKPEVTFFGYDDDWRGDSDSVLGLQGLVVPSERWQITGQVVTRGFSFDNDHRFETEVEWLFLSYQWQPGVRLRAGRLRVPHYLFSESLEVRHSYTWVRPPVNVYAGFLSVFTHMDGADITLSGLWGDSEWELQSFAGQVDARFLTNKIDIHTMLGSSFTWRYQDWLLRYNIHLDRTTLTNKVAVPLIDGFNQLGELDPGFNRIADGFSAEREWFTYHGLAVHWEPGDWALIAEQFYAYGPKQHFSATITGWYASLQYRVGSVTPYGVVGSYRSRVARHLTRPLQAIDPAAYPVPADIQGQIQFLRDVGLFVLKAYDAGEDSVTLGMRWDLHRQVALKGEVQYFDFTPNTTGNMIPPDLFTKPSAAVLYSLSLDMVF